MNLGGWVKNGIAQGIADKDEQAGAEKIEQHSAVKAAIDQKIEKAAENNIENWNRRFGGLDGLSAEYDKHIGEKQKEDKEQNQPPGSLFWKTPSIRQNTHINKP